MAKAGAYVVRDDDPGAGDDQPRARSGNVDRLFPYTLKGLTDALEEARFRSFSGAPQVVLVMTEGGMRAIRRYEQGHERPVRGNGTLNGKRKRPGCPPRASLGVRYLIRR